MPKGSYNIDNRVIDYMLHEIETDQCYIIFTNGNIEKLDLDEISNRLLTFSTITVSKVDNVVNQGRQYIKYKNGNGALPQPPYVRVISQIGDSEGDFVFEGFDRGTGLRSKSVVVSANGGIEYLYGDFQMVFAALITGGAAPTTFDYRTYKDGVLVNEYLDAGLGCPINIFEPFEIDTVVISDHEAPVTNNNTITWGYAQFGQPGSLRILKNGAEVANTTPGAIVQNGAFQINGGEEITIQSISNFGRSRLLVTNVTDSVVIFDSTNNIEQDFVFNTVVGKDYTVQSSSRS